MDRPDSELLVRLGEGDLAAFDEIVERFERRLIGYFRGLSGDRQLAEDCAQEVFIRVYRARESYRPEAALATFVFRIARNYWIDVYRSRKVRPEMHSLDESSDDGEDRALVEVLEGDTESPVRTLAAAEERRRLRRAMALLPEIQQSVLALAGGQGLKYEEVAEVLGIPVGTVKSRVHAAVQNLKKLMGAEEPRAPK